MTRRVSIILAVAILVLSSLMAFPGCSGKKTEVDTGNSTTDTGNSTTDTGNSTTDTGNSTTDTGNSTTDTGNSATDTGNSTTDGAGKPQLLMFTQEGCPPCIPAHDIVNELEKEMSDKVTFTVIYAEEDFEAFRKYGVQATPTIVVLDGSGDVVGMAAGVPDKDALKSELEKLL